MESSAGMGSSAGLRGVFGGAARGLRRGCEGVLGSLTGLRGAFGGAAWDLRRGCEGSSAETANGVGGGLGGGLCEGLCEGSSAEGLCEGSSAGGGFFFDGEGGGLAVGGGRRTGRWAADWAVVGGCFLGREREGRDCF